MEAVCVLGNQLFPNNFFNQFEGMPVFMAEDQELCTYYKFHKHKIVLFLSAMRHFKESLCKLGFDVNYHELSLNDSTTYIYKLSTFIKRRNVRVLHIFEIEDKFMESRFHRLSQNLEIELRVHESPMFTCGRKEFSDYLAQKTKPFMKSFYEMQRKRLNILMDNGKPIGGKFSFDSQNRRKIPKGYEVPKRKFSDPDQIDQHVMSIVKEYFPDHPGNVENFWLPTSRSSALTQFRDFLDKHLLGFGPYQDAIIADDGFLHHSLISGALNIGILTPKEIVSETIAFSEERKVAIESVEGFVRQVIGWREFVRGVYQHYSDTMDAGNFWDSNRTMKDCWYTGKTGLPPLDDSIKRAIQTGYNHHIERLMILANLMNLCEIQPKEVFKWFMEMYIDSSDWVMSANVYGMGLMSDGGIFATKPYISGSNYIIKMSNYKKGSWCDIWDGLYWRFVEKHIDFFNQNPRMRMMTKVLHNMHPDRKNKIFEAANSFIDKVSE